MAEEYYGRLVHAPLYNFEECTVQTIDPITVSVTFQLSQLVVVELLGYAQVGVLELPEEEVNENMY